MRKANIIHYFKTTFNARNHFEFETEEEEREIEIDEFNIVMTIKMTCTISQTIGTTFGYDVEYIIDVNNITYEVEEFKIFDENNNEIEVNYINEIQTILNK